ncbi:hypothetical protein BKA67DRAFT_551208, partial [Truncatella angustata]
MDMPRLKWGATWMGTLLFRIAPYSYGVVLTRPLCPGHEEDPWLMHRFASWLALSSRRIQYPGGPRGT